MHEDATTKLQTSNLSMILHWKKFFLMNWLLSVSFSHVEIYKRKKKERRAILQCRKRVPMLTTVVWNLPQFRHQKSLPFKLSTTATSLSHLIAHKHIYISRIVRNAISNGIYQNIIYSNKSLTCFVKVSNEWAQKKKIRLLNQTREYYCWNINSDGFW